MPNTSTRAQWRAITYGTIGVTIAVVATLIVNQHYRIPARQLLASVFVHRSVPAMLDLNNKHLPIERYLFTSRQRGELSQARLTLAERCLVQYGLSIPRPDLENDELGPTDGDSRAANTMANTARRYGITDPALAARYGYRSTPDTAPDHDYPEPQLSAAVYLVLTGEGTDGTYPKSKSTTQGQRTVTYLGMPIPEGGCLAEATRQLGSTSGNIGDGQLSNEVNMESFSRTMAEPNTAKAIHAWSACMQEAGFSYPDPLQAPGPQFADTDEATPEEIAVAVADVECKRRTNLVGYWYTAEWQYQERAIRSHAAEFERIFQEHQTMLTRARAILSKPPSDAGGAGERKNPPQNNRSTSHLLSIQ